MHKNPGAQYPVFRPLPELVKMGLDNPDNYYLSASVSGGAGLTNGF